MAILRSHGVMIADSIPTHAPTAEQARLARLDAPETYTGAIIPDNADLGTALQAPETAIEAINQDGNHALVVRSNSTESVPPTALEVPNPVIADTADVSLTSGKVEKRMFIQTMTPTWVLVFIKDYADVTNLGYTVSPTQGTVAWT